MSQFSTSNPEETELKNEIIETKRELETISQVDEFAKYSKTERKINQLRQKLESISKDQSMAKIQAKAAFHTMWRILSVSLYYTVWKKRKFPYYFLMKSWKFTLIKFETYYVKPICGAFCQYHIVEKYTKALLCCNFSREITQQNLLSASTNACFSTLRKHL